MLVTPGARGWLWEIARQSRSLPQSPDMEVLEILLVEVPHYAICALFPLGGVQSSLRDTHPLKEQTPMTHHPDIRKTRQSGAGALALFGAFASLCLGISVSAGDIKVVGTTLLSLKYPFLVSIDDAIKTEAAKQGIDLLMAKSIGRNNISA
jgi:hypothetical protein